MRKAVPAVLLVALSFLANFAVSAQETELKVVDEVVAQVNDGVITLSRVKREMKIIVDTMVEQGKQRDAAAAEVEAKQGEIIAGIIEEELLLQKGKELGVEGEVDAAINQRFLEIMRQQNLKSLTALFEEMQKQGLDPQDVRENWRRQFTKDFVIQREVSGRVYWGWNGREIKAYYEKNKDKFFKPEVVTLSRIFLAFAGRDENAVRDKAKIIVADLRKGGDFAKTAIDNSDAPDVRETNGTIGAFEIPQLERICKACVKPVAQTQKGGITEPIETVEGIEIFRVDDRKEASKDSVFDENDVRRAMTFDVLDEKRKEYMTKMRNESYIRINDNYRPIVSPYFVKEAPKEDPKKTK